ncbi:hypothetical protein L202_06718 [Cryptococcus amylolentus CBS 6039]|uniref:Uncharacterized protein n=1 Tax=Cryptococcus amylolentus CBS 6039 TaxID=1295533 RepID=A0A1E3HGY9_9TREE|nr:hypothetical protein L202_06718 [Cryptococcus amylolentus CBS 6039]ODN75599.1 hypothetical protein L202_06718 [Cryptococcus amylolentus CBS 6039]
MFLYNVHAPHKTFALTHKANETQPELLKRIYAKSGLGEGERKGTGLVYEFEGGRWSLDDDDDLQILFSRFPPSSTPSVTLHLKTPTAPGQQHPHHAQTALGNGNAPPPAYPTSPSVKSKTTKSKKAKSHAGKEVGVRAGGGAGEEVDANGARAGTTDGKTPVKRTIKPLSPLSDPHHLGAPIAGGSGQGRVVSSTSHLAPPGAHSYSPAHAHGQGSKLNGAPSVSGVSTKSRAKSVMSTVSRKSKYGDPYSEDLGVVKRRAWEEFHANNGVRTVMGKVGEISGVRMLLKAGYRHVYVSREFAIRHKLVPKKFGTTGGYAGIRTIGQIPITVGSRTALHAAYLTEEKHFDVVLGRSWMEKMGVKIDPLDQTILTYMDSGEPIECDIVVLRDEKGDIVTIT